MKTESVRIRLTKEERRKIDTLATRLCLSRSELLRRFIHSGLSKNESTQIISWDADVIRSIRDCNMLILRIGNNVNQIARACNMGNTNVSLAEEITALRNVLDNIKKVVEKCL